MKCLPDQLARKRWALATGVCLLAVTAPASAGERTALAPAITVSAPSGFESVAVSQRSVVEVFSLGDYLGTAEVRLGAGTIRFLEPATLVDRLHGLQNAAPVLSYLAGQDLASNATLVCRDRSANADCGTVTPDVAAVIFDASRLRVDLFVNPRFLDAPRRQDDYLPDPQDNLSLLGVASMVVSGSRSDRLASFQNTLIASLGANRLRSDLAIATDLGVQADRLLVERDVNGMRASAGAMWSPGSGLMVRQKFLGVGLESQTDTRRDRLQVEGSPLIVFLDERSRVDVLRDNKIIASGVYAPGNQLLDTSSLPEGSYDLTIKIHSSRGSVREERRLFTKQADIAVEGFDRFRLQGGVAIDDRYGRSLTPSGSLFLGASYAHRVNENLALDATVDWSEGHFNGEVGAFILAPFAVVRLAAVGVDDAIRGGIVQARSTGTSPLNFSLDVRHLRDVDMREDQYHTAPVDSQGAPEPQRQPYAAREFTQVAGNLSYSLPQAQLFVSGTYTGQSGAWEDSYSVGPSVRWRLFERGRIRLLFDGSVSLTERGQTGFAGLSLTLSGGRASTSMQVGQAFSSAGMRDDGRGTIATFDHSLQLAGFAGGDLGLAGFAQTNAQGSLVGGSADFKNDAAAFSAEAIGGSQDGRSSAQYTLGGRAGYFLGSGEAGLAADVRTDSRAVVRVSGGRATDAFEVFVDQRMAGSIVGNESVALALPPYRSYSIRIKQASQGSVSYDGRAREVTVFPGQVASVVWSVVPTALVYGRLVGADQRPVAYASISTAGAWGETDANGYFQIEAASGGELMIRMTDGRNAARMLPEFAASAGTFKLGELTCCTLGDRTHVAAKLPR